MSGPKAGLLGVWGTVPPEKVMDAAGRSPWRGPATHVGTAGLGALWALGSSPHAIQDGIAVALHGRLDGWRGPGPDPGVGREPCAAIARAYLRCGPGFAVHLIGDYTILLLDTSAGILVGVRDWLGTMPLFWGRAGDVIAIGSEVKQVLALLGAAPTPDDAMLKLWTQDSDDVPSDATFASGVRAVRPAGQIAVDANGLTAWRRPVRFAPVEAGANEAALRIRAALEVAVSRRSEGAKQLGVFLSGGLDSSSVAATAAALSRRGGPTVSAAYTVVIDGVPSADESKFARAVAEHCDIPLRLITLPPRAVLDWGTGGAFRLHDGPTHPLFVIVASVIRAAAEDGVDVLLGGQAADHWQSLIDFAMELAALRRDWSTAARWAGHLGREQPAAMVWRLAKLGPKIVLGRRAETAFERSGDDFWLRNVFECEEREASRRGLRVASPFADIELAELLSGLPTRVRLHPGLPKKAIRTAMDGLLPPMVISRTARPDYDVIWPSVTDIRPGLTPTQHAEATYEQIWKGMIR